jgi:DNA-directed RNA polymerase specialized sigma24 family protein
LETTNHKLFQELYSPVHLQLSRFCRAISGNREDAEDLMNDTILAMLQNMTRLKDESANISSGIYLITIYSDKGFKTTRLIVM